MTRSASWRRTLPSRALDIDRRGGDGATGQAADEGFGRAPFTPSSRQSEVAGSLEQLEGRHTRKTVPVVRRGAEEVRMRMEPPYLRTMA